VSKSEAEAARALALLPSLKGLGSRALIGTLLIPVLPVLAGTMPARNWPPQGGPRPHLGHQTPTFGADHHALVLIQQSTVM
jgi:hypothetical protein